jgi:hypothetical protein
MRRRRCGVAVVAVVSAVSRSLLKWRWRATLAPRTTSCPVVRRGRQRRECERVRRMTTVPTGMSRVATIERAEPETTNQTRDRAATHAHAVERQTRVESGHCRRRRRPVRFIARSGLLHGACNVVAGLGSSRFTLSLAGRRATRTAPLSPARRDRQHAARDQEDARRCRCHRAADGAGMVGGGGGDDDAACAAAAPRESRRASSHSATSCGRHHRTATAVGPRRRTASHCARAHE